MKNIKLKVTSFLLCLSMLMSFFVPVAQSLRANGLTAGEVTIMSGGKEVSEIIVTPKNKTEILASYSKSTPPISYQWQIFAEISGEKIWVNIADAKSDLCAVSYSMIANMLQDGYAEVRCVVNDSGALCYSESVRVSVAGETPEITINQMRTMLLPKAAVRLAADEGPAVTDVDICTITIEYLFKDGGEAWAPYTARIAKGTAFNKTVVNPVIVGFDARKADGITDAPVVNLNYESVDEDITIKILYCPKTVKYRVEHHLQNIVDDNYTIFKTEQKEGPVNALTDAYADQREGFYDLPFKNIEIAADGSTVVEIYYDRLYYLMTLKLEGGYGLDSMYARYGTPIQDIIPVRYGYTFGGWLKLAQDEKGGFIQNDDGTWQTVGAVSPTLPATIPAAKSGYIAQWNATTSNYTVIYIVENPDNHEQYDYMDHEVLSATTGSVVNITQEMMNKTFPHCTFNAEKTSAANNNVVKGDGTTVLYVYYDLEEYTFRFYFATQSGGSYSINGNMNPGSLTFNKPLGTPNAEWQQLLSELATEERNNEIYYYKEITANYGAYVFDEWPIDVPSNGKNAQFIGWGAQSGSVIHSEGRGNGRALNGPYERLDDRLFAPNASEQWMIACFNTNGGGGMNNFNCQLLIESADPNSSEYELFKEYTVYGSKADKLWCPNLTGCAEATQRISGNTVFFEYKRIRYNLLAHNYGVEAYNKEFKYGADLTNLADFPYTPPYPATLPQDVYEFAGWYTTSDHIPGTEFDFEAGMPANDTQLFAYWKPKVFNVRFFTTVMLSEQIGETQSVSYGELVTWQPPIPPAPYDDVDFVGWFYMSGGTEKAVDFSEFTVKENVDIYAKWSGATDVPYTVEYRVASDAAENAGVEIATSINGYTKAGNNRTFEAKVGTALYSDYRKGFFPKTNSHTIMMVPGQENKFIFEYVEVKQPSYTVRYLDAEDGKVLHEEKFVRNDEQLSVVTENYIYISGYVVDAFQKRLIITANIDENIIEFYYTKSTSTTTFPYTITHYWQDANNPDLYTPFYIDNLQGEKGMVLDIGVLSQDGFIFDHAQKGYYVNDKFVTEEIACEQGDMQIHAGALPEMGMHIDLYYNRQSYPYVIEHILVDSETGAETTLKSETGEMPYGAAFFGDALSAEADPGSENYLPPYYESESRTYQRKRIAIEESDVPEFNVITFYYVEKQIVFLYVPVIEGYHANDLLSLSSETVRIYSDTAEGCDVLKNSGVTFAGWYIDEDCTIPAPDSWIDGTSIRPQKNGDMYDDLNAVDGQIALYAKFDLNASDLIITKTGAEDENQVFVYEIKNDSGFSMEVTITGNDSVTVHNLPLGSYTVTEQNGWSWRYNNGNDVSQNADHSSNGTEVPFSSVPTEFYWIDGHSKTARNKKKGGAE